MKMISHLVIFILGAGVGIWWGVNHPTEAQNIHDSEQRQAAKIQAAVSREKIALLQRFQSSTSQPDKDSAEYKKMLSDEQQKLQDAKSKLAN